ncbi:LysM peptidoglycan-binding domain-containing protein [Virgibacillus sp. 179-BFC.A HS]|uniref:LysM peptidoglycan-binding domain-containing protein n=1 Tax=Tigheibacillus jepli TaxID=3035914 RepID=A0ABU5CFU4_9BACI|nr:LysM peptidoglycan-binding and 3D domain-containing protein [Virgibacillus sp. 179-BFC.A HS]MDY0404453.1 LysM peptidoglycan-binding domain-containing protein [Virgibacillus sp. 179-BFC.A HS]
MKKVVASLAMGVIITGAAVTNVSAQEYKVQNGDSLWSIAEEYHTSVDELVELNDLDSTVIHPNQKIFINEDYEVQKGDTLTKIANKFDVDIKDIKNWNNLDSDIIVVGQKLEIKGVNVPKENEPTPVAKKAPETSNNTQQASAQPAKKAEQNNNNNAEPAKKAEQSNNNNNAPKGKTVSVKATAYTANCDGCSGVTSTGIDLKADPNAKVIAVDPNVIPLGSKVYVEGYGYATAGDVGGAIKGHKIDVHMPTDAKADAWGVKTVNVTIVN